MVNVKTGCITFQARTKVNTFLIEIRTGNIEPCFFVTTRHIQFMRLCNTLTVENICIIDIDSSYTI